MRIIRILIPPPLPPLALPANRDSSSCTLCSSLSMVLRRAETSSGVGAILSTVQRSKKPDQGRDEERCCRRSRYKVSVRQGACSVNYCSASAGGELAPMEMWLHTSDPPRQ